MKSKIVIFISIFFLLSCSAQKKQPIEKYNNTSVIKSREDVNNLTEKYFSNYKYDNILVFSISDKWYLFITKNKTLFESFYVKKESDNDYIEKLEVTSNEFKILNKAFNKNIYNKDIVDFHSKKYKFDVAQGNKTYFVLTDKSKIRHAEFSLSVIIDPPPINKKVYYYLVTKLLNRISIDSEGNNTD